MSGNKKGGFKTAQDRGQKETVEFEIFETQIFARHMLMYLP